MQFSKDSTRRPEVNPVLLLAMDSSFGAITNAAMRDRISQSLFFCLRGPSSWCQQCYRCLYYGFQASYSDILGSQTPGLYSTSSDYHSGLLHDSKPSPGLEFPSVSENHSRNLDRLHGQRFAHKPCVSSFQVRSGQFGVNWKSSTLV